VVAYWDVVVIWLQSICWSSEQGPCVDGMVHACVEIRIVANLHWKVGFRLMFREESGCLEGGVVFENFGVGG